MEGTQEAARRAASVPILMCHGVGNHVFLSRFALTRPFLGQVKLARTAVVMKAMISRECKYIDIYTCM